MIEVHFLPAQGGDFLWLRYGSGKMTSNLIIDSGFDVCKRDMAAIMNRIRYDGGVVEAVILTHTDNDHIQGFLGWLGMEPFQPPQINRILFNTGRGVERVTGYRPRFYPEDQFLERKTAEKYSVGQARTLLDWLKRRELLSCLDDYTTMESDPQRLPSGALLRLISPSCRGLEQMAKLWFPAEKAKVWYGAPEICRKDLDELMEEPFEADTSVSNGASIAFLFEFEEFRLAFLGDARSDVCLEGLRRLGYSPEAPYQADLVKLSHHGSPHNLTEELLRALPSQHFLLSTSAAASVRLQKITIARILKCLGRASIYRNCSTDALLTQADRDKYVPEQLKLYHLGYGGTRMETIRKGLTLYGKTASRLRAY